VIGLSAVVVTTRACLTPCAASNKVYSSVVDIFNVVTGTWSTAALSQARISLAAASLPNAGVVIFAGGLSSSCDYYARCCNMGLGVRGMCEWVECGCAYDASLSHALCSEQWGLQCCRHLQCGDWGLEHCSPQPGSIWSCSRIASECWSRVLRWWLKFVL
jgi:hypothetical protein